MSWTPFDTRRFANTDPPKSVFVSTYPHKTTTIRITRQFKQIDIISNISSQLIRPLTTQIKSLNYANEFHVKIYHGTVEKSAPHHSVDPTSPSGQLNSVPIQNLVLAYLAFFSVPAIHHCEFEIAQRMAGVLPFLAYPFHNIVRHQTQRINH